MIQCKSKTLKGTQCLRTSKYDLCWQHQQCEVNNIVSFPAKG
jgi:hypothetical protein